MERRIQFLNNSILKNIKSSKSIKSVILPVGTIEAHGIIPLGTDIIIPEKISIDIAEFLNCFIAPSLNYGITKSLLPYSGSNTLSKSTFQNIIFDIATSLKKDGFKNLIIINGHGGNNSALKEVAQKIFNNLKIYTIIVHWWIYCSDITDNIYNQKGGHGGIDETAMIHAIDEKLVNWELIDNDQVKGMVYKNGIDIIPFPAPIIYYKNKEGIPINDIVKAKKFYGKVIDKIRNEVKLLLDKFENI